MRWWASKRRVHFEVEYNLKSDRLKKIFLPPIRLVSLAVAGGA